MDVVVPNENHVELSAVRRLVRACIASSKGAMLKLGHTRNLLVPSKAIGKECSFWKEGQRLLPPTIKWKVFAF